MTLADKPIECKLHITKDDYVAMNNAWLYVRKKSGRAFALRLFFLAILSAIMMSGLRQATGGNWVVILPRFALGATIAAAALFIFRKQFTRLVGVILAQLHYNLFPADKDDQIVSSACDGVYEKSPKFEGRLSWQAFHEFMRTKSHLIHWVNPIQAYNVPFRMWADRTVERLWECMKILPNARQIEDPA